jgi:hypothetical protein
MELIDCDTYGRPTDILRQRTISVYEIYEADPELNSDWAVVIISILALILFIGIIFCLLL